MKQVIAKKRKFSYKDIIRWISIIVVNYAALIAYVFFLIWIHDLNNGVDFDFVLKDNSWGILYPLTIGPMVSAVAQIVYSERGSVSMRGIMWFHLLMMLIMVPIVIWVTM